MGSLKALKVLQQISVIFGSNSTWFLLLIKKYAYYSLYRSVWTITVVYFSRKRSEKNDFKDNLLWTSKKASVGGNHCTVPVMGFEALYYTLVYWLKNRHCIWRQKNQVDVREVLDFRVSKKIVNQKGNLSVLSLERWVEFSYPLFK